VFSIIIPFYNNIDLTCECIQSIRENTENYEIILIDNGSSPTYAEDRPGTWRPVNYNGPIVIRNKSNIGFPAAVNQGIRESRGDIIILLNNDTIVTPNWANRLEWHITNHCSIVGPMTNYSSGLQQTGIPVYYDKQELYTRSMQFQSQNAFQYQSVNWLIGFCMMFRRSLYNTLGPFDESLWPCSGEEIDFCFNARHNGHQVCIAKDVYIHHYGSKTFFNMVSMEEYLSICNRNEKRLFDKWGDKFTTQTITNQGEQK